MLISGLDDAADMRSLAPAPVPVTIPTVTAGAPSRPLAAGTHHTPPPDTSTQTGPSPTFAAFVEALKNIFGFEVSGVDPYDRVPNGPLDILALTTDEIGLRTHPLLSIDVFA